MWHGNAAFELKAAALALGSLLATPRALDYDLLVLAVAIAFFVLLTFYGSMRRRLRIDAAPRRTRSFDCNQFVQLAQA